MGVVWLAERFDGSLKRRVALKLPRLTWGAGMAERMARERDIDALLEHPNIARLYDAGVDSRGRPYLALEYIDGKPLDDWCSAKALSIPDRLRLFLQVIRAVAYAHGRLVVHRDLKPSNVLVTEDGQAHLLDFGIAKLLDSVSADDRLTQAGGRVLTPHYASPEQIRGDPVTVASDVYSLGVLLYELLAGAPPYAPERKSLGALEEAILAAEPPPASGRAKDRPTAKALHGELDSILGKALRREPSLRYATADALAQDIDRFLKGERVLAQPDSLGYRARKTLRRNKAAFAAGGAVLVAVLGGAGVSIVQAKKASDAAERARVVKEFVVDVFKVNERGTAGNQELRQLPAELLLERGAKLIETKFPGQPQLQAELFGVVGGIFADMTLPVTCTFAMSVWNPLPCTSAPTGTLEHCDEVIVNVTGWLLGFAAALRAAWAASAATPSSRMASRAETNRPIFIVASPGRRRVTPRPRGRTGCFEERESMDMACSVRLVARAQGVGSDSAPALPLSDANSTPDRTSPIKKSIRALRSPGKRSSSESSWRATRRSWSFATPNWRASACRGASMRPRPCWPWCRTSIRYGGRRGQIPCSRRYVAPRWRRMSATSGPEGRTGAAQKTAGGVGAGVGASGLGSRSKGLVVAHTSLVATFR